MTEERTKKAIIAGLEERLAAIAAIADGYDEYMSDPSDGPGEHWGDCPLGGGDVSPVDYPELYDLEPGDGCDDGQGHEDWTWTWNPEKGAAACVCHFSPLAIRAIRQKSPTLAWIEVRIQEEQGRVDGSITSALLRHCERRVADRKSVV